MTKGLNFDEDDDDDDNVDEDDVPLEEMGREEVDSVMKALQDGAKVEMEKAKHTETQNKLWQRLLATRIKMQGLVQSANMLPLPEDAESLRMHRGDELRKHLRANAELLATLRLKLLGNHPDFAKAQAALADAPLPPSGEQSSDVWWAWLARSNAASKSAEEEIVTACNQRANVQSGRNFKAFGRPVMDQINTSLLQDREKLIRRTQLNRSGKVPIGRGDASAGGDPYYEENLFDDSEFYGQLLKTFLEGSLGATAGGGRVLARDSRIKKVHIAKSKLNMAIQEKLLNFMAPTASNVLPPMADALFASLFGQIPQANVEK